MSSASLVPGTHHGLVVRGVLDFATVGPLAAEGERLLVGPGVVEIDLSGVTSANSAGLALLLEWLDLARRRQLRLRFRNLPEPLVRLAELTNLTEVLPLAHG
ncbi:MAG: STAS domain-containing protein [Chromatiaceae bacterium]|nr:STAS domain-containing protein [Chromatiaceae bacterium]